MPLFGNAAAAFSGAAFGRLRYAARGDTLFVRVLLGGTFGGLGVLAYSILTLPVFFTTCV